MTLILKSGKKKFSITDSMRKYLTQLLSYDPSFTIHQIMFTENELSAEEVDLLTEKLDFLLHKTSIYEFIHSSGSCIPVINPDNTELKTGFVVNPISNENKKVLEQFYNFVKYAGKIYIS